MRGSQECTGDSLARTGRGSYSAIKLCITILLILMVGAGCNEANETLDEQPTQDDAGNTTDGCR